MRRPTSLLVLALVAVSGCPRPTDTEPANAGAPEPEPEPAPSETSAAADPPAEAPADATLTVDHDRSSVGFAVARATVGHIGSFERFEGSLVLVAGQPSRLDIEVETGSVVADRAGLTHHLQGADFFDVEKFPTATFSAREFRPDPDGGPDAYLVRGTMRLHGIDSPLEFPATVEVEPTQVVGRATLDISAKAFGIRYAGMEAELAEDAVQLEIELVFPRVGPG